MRGPRGLRLEFEFAKLPAGSPQRDSWGEVSWWKEAIDDSKVVEVVSPEAHKTL